MEGVGPVLLHMLLNTMPFVTLFLKMHFNSFRERRFCAFFFLLRQIAFWKSVTMDILVFTFLNALWKAGFFVAFLCNITPFWKVTTTFWKALWHLLEWRYNAFIRVIMCFGNTYTDLQKISYSITRITKQQWEKKQIVKHDFSKWYWKRFLFDCVSNVWVVLKYWKHDIHFHDLWVIRGLAVEM